MRRIILVLLFLSGVEVTAQGNSMLLVIDMQTNLLSPGKGGLHVDSSQVALLIQNVNRNIQIAASQHIPVAYTVVEWTNPLQNYFTNNACKKGAPGVSIDRRIDVVDTLIFHKPVKNSFSNKYLCDYIQKNNIREIFIAGIMAEGCVSSTVVNGLRKHLRMRMVAPAIGSSTRSRLVKALEKCEERGAERAGNIEERPAE
jgi:nicotinamidase/pyrazinamidase